jgi:hypothetical protein
MVLEFRGRARFLCIGRVLFADTDEDTCRVLGSRVHVLDRFHAFMVSITCNTHENRLCIARLGVRRARIHFFLPRPENQEYDAKYS